MFPLRTDKPRFDENNPISLRRYFEDVEELCVLNYGTPTAEQMIHRALYYTPDPRTEDLWKGAVAPGIQWDAFKAKIMRLYPGSDEAFSDADLDQFLEVWKKKRGFKSQEDVGRYHREFSAIADRMISDGRLSTQETDRAYLRGMSQEFRGKVDERILSLRMASGQFSGGYGREQVYAAALWVVDVRRFYSI